MRCGYRQPISRERPDALSWGKKAILWMKWTLCLKAVQTAFGKFGRTNIDLFASQHNNNYPHFLPITCQELRTVLTFVKCCNIVQ
jgi:hypothetical protein